MALAELFLAAFLQVLFDRLASREVLNFVGRYVGLGKKLGKWKDTLEKIQAVLDDADKKQDKNVGVKLWLDKLRDLAYDVDDILDEFATEASLCKLRGENQGWTSKVRKLIPARYSPALTARAVKTRIRQGSKINKITARFNEILNEKDELRLKKIGVPGRASEESSPCIVREDRVFGRDRDKEAILKLLLCKKYNNDAEVSVISIHGMGGVGKTTLAHLVFDNEDVKRHFDVKAWADVSYEYDVLSITRNIYDFVITETREVKDSTYLQASSTTDLRLLRRELKKELSGKKFLVILDDVWTRDYGQWCDLCAPFLEGTPESRIIITTRDLGVSLMTKGPAHHLQLLTDEECFFVLTGHALGEGKSFDTAASKLESIGVEIARKCKGLPLAAFKFASLLRLTPTPTPDPQTWQDASKKGIFRETCPTLILSYQDLPSNIRRCFAYCSIFPKDYEFEEKQLVLLWMAEGLIQSQEEKQMEALGSEYFQESQEEEKQMEAIGSEYFQELVKKSLFQKSSNDESRFTMHPFLNDLALWVAKGTCFRMDDRFRNSNEQKNLKKARHLSYLCGHQRNVHTNFEALSELKRLRTFLPFVLPNQGTCNVSLQLISKVRRLRVLSLSGFHITELPKSIGNLKHLRYLDLSNTSIESMPKSTTTLYNLQTLISENCSKLEKLPSKFRKLVNLRHLNIRNTRLSGMPLQMDKLTCLQTLSDFVVGKGHFSRVKELGPLSHLRETLCISRLENVVQPGDAMGANLSQKENLVGLLLEWSCNAEPQDRTIDLEVLKELQPHENLKELTIRCYRGTKFPTWLGAPSFCNMVCMRLENCKRCKSLPPVGQLSLLKDLSIVGMAGVENVGPEFYDGDVLPPFKSLETLRFENMEQWDNWIPCEEFPQLRQFSIQNCPKLTGRLPNHLLSIAEIIECPLLQ